MNPILLAAIPIHVVFSLATLLWGCLELGDKYSDHRKLAAWTVLTFWLGPLWFAVAVAAGIAMAAKKAAEAFRIVLGRA